MHILTGAITVGVLTLIGAAAQAADKRGVVSQQGWFAGLPVQLQIDLPKAHGGAAPEAPSDRYDDVVVYITAPTLGARATDESLAGANPDRARSLPPHDLVLTRWASPKRPAEIVGYFVVPGPRADEASVQSLPDVASTPSGAPLVRDIFVGTDWVKLTNHAIVEYGLVMGWLALERSDYAGLISSRYLDEKVGLDVQIRITPPASLPAQSELQ